MIPNGIQNNPYMISNQQGNTSLLDNYERRSKLNSFSYNPISKPQQYSTSITHHDDPTIFQLQRLHRQNSDLQLKISQLQNQQKFITEENLNLKNQINKYAEALQKMYSLHNQQQIIIGKLKNFQHQNNQYTESLNHRNLQLNNQIQNLALDREFLAHRLNQQDLRNVKQLQGISLRLNQKNNECFQLRKRVNSLLELKTRLQQEISALSFSLDNFRMKADLDIRQKSLKLENLQRTFHQTLVGKNQETRHLNDKIRTLEEQVRKLRQNNTLLLTRNQQNSKFANEVVPSNKLDNLSRIYADSNLKMKSGGKQNLGNKLNDLLEERQKKLEEKDNEIHHLSQKLKSYENKINSLQLSSQNTLQKPLFEAENQTKIVGSMILTLQTLRSGINKLIFQRFVISVDHADKRKQNSLVLFITNINQFVQKQGHQIKHSVDAYYKARNGIKQYLKKQDLAPPIRQKLIVAIGKLVKFQNDFRDKINKWIQGTLVYAIQQKRLDKTEKNKDILFLFRLLTIKYRIVYPISGKSFTIDEDLKAVLEHKIVSSIKDFLLLKNNQ